MRGMGGANSIIWIIGAVVVIVVVLKLLGLYYPQLLHSQTRRPWLRLGAASCARAGPS